MRAQKLIHAHVSLRKVSLLMSFNDISFWEATTLVSSSPTCLKSSATDCATALTPQTGGVCATALRCDTLFQIPDPYTASAQGHARRARPYNCLRADARASPDAHDPAHEPHKWAHKTGQTRTS